MMIQQIVNYLNEAFHLQLKSDYYQTIHVWQDWWKGYHEPFHRFREQDQGGKLHHRDLFTLKMAKKICEDWAALLLNEKTQVTLQDTPSNVFLQGEDGSGGVLGACDFWQHANRLVEQAFYSGTGAIILRVGDMLKQENGVTRADEKTTLRLEYLPAQNIIPLSVRQGDITEAAFCSEILENGERRVYLEVHRLGANGYIISNHLFREQGQSLLSVPSPAALAEPWETRSFTPLFSILQPNIANSIDEGCGLGVSVFANAIDNLKGVDLAFNNFCRDFQLGGKKVFYNRDLVPMGENGQALTPDDLCQQLFLALGDKGPDDPQQIYEHNPELRVADNAAGIQAQLDYLSFKCGLGSKRYRFDSSSAVTATQYVGEQQDLVQNVNKHYIAVEKLLRGVVRAILWAGKEVLRAPVDPETKITVQFDDSVIVDKETERLRDKEDVRDGILQKWEFRAKWYGEDESTAKKMIQQDDAAPGFGLEE